MIGGMYTPNRPRRPFFRPCQPPIGMFGDRPQVSTVPSLAGFCSSAPPSPTHPPACLSIAFKSSMHRASYPYVSALCRTNCVHRVSNHSKCLKGNHDLVVFDEITDKHQYFLSHNRFSSLAWIPDSHGSQIILIGCSFSWVSLIQTDFLSA
jgi:hypothetical protein